MKLSTTLVTIFLLFINYSYAVLIAINYSDSDKCKVPCESFDFLREIDKIPRIDSVSAIAKYCLRSEEDSTWKLSLYEHIVPLAIKIQKECRRYSFSGKIDLGVDKIFLSSLSGGESGGCVRSCIGSKKACEKRNSVCKTDISEKYNIYDHINDFRISSCLKGMEKILHLFNIYLPIKWDLNISCDDEKIPVLGSHYIHISRICTEEQLKKIEENKKKKAGEKNE